MPRLSWHKPLTNIPYNCTFWCAQLWSDARHVLGPDYTRVRFWGGELDTSSGYELAGSPHHHLNAGLHSCVGISIGQTKHIGIHVHLVGTPGEIHMHLSLIRIILKSHKVHFGATTQPLFPSLDSHFSQVIVSTLFFLFLSGCISSLGRRAYCTSQHRAQHLSLADREARRRIRWSKRSAWRRLSGMHSALKLSQTSLKPAIMARMMMRMTSPPQASSQQRPSN